MEKARQVYGYANNMTPTTKLSRERKKFEEQMAQLKMMIDM